MRTSSEVYNKLIELEFPEKEVVRVIKDLIDLEYINDEEYVRKFIESNKKTKKLSKSMVKIKLKNKGISEDIIEKYFYELDISDIDAIIKLLEKKKFLKTVDFDERNKIKLYCVRKGFSISDVNKAIKIYEKGEDI
jgi:regulatory protein